MIKLIIPKNRTGKVDGILMDLGVSSMQLESPERVRFIYNIFMQIMNSDSQLIIQTIIITRLHHQCTGIFF